MPKEKVVLKEFDDGSVIVDFPPGFFQKGLKHLDGQPGSKFTLELTEESANLKTETEEIITAAPSDKQPGTNPYQGWTLKEVLDLIRHAQNQLKSKGTS